MDILSKEQLYIKLLYECKKIRQVLVKNGFSTEKKEFRHACINEPTVRAYKNLLDNYNMYFDHLTKCNNK